MYIKVKNNQIDFYSLEQLRKDNPQVSFPLNPSKEILNEFDVFECVETPVPNLTYKDTLTEAMPELIDGVWHRKWIVGQKSTEEIANIEKSLRAEAYKEESDPIFFKAQRGEASMDEWINKINEIKTRYS
jgi:hypothetical protein